MALERSSSYDIGHSGCSDGVDGRHHPSGSDDPVAEPDRHALGRRVPRARADRPADAPSPRTTPVGRQSPATDHRPHRNLGAIPHRRERADPADSQQVGVGTRPTPRRPPHRWPALRLRVPLPARSRRRRRRAATCARSGAALPSAHPIVVGVDRQHRRIATAQQGLADEVGPSDDANRRVVGQGLDQHVGSGIRFEFVGQRRRTSVWIGGGEDGRAQPPQSARSADAVRRCVDRRRRGPPDRSRDRAARRPSRGPASVDPHPRPWPRSGAVRSDASIATLLPHWGVHRWRATVCCRGEQPGPRYEADLARRRDTPAGGMADHVPPGQRGPRSLHQRELMGAARQRRASSRACAAPTLGSTSWSQPTPTGPRAFLGPLTEDFLVYCDPDRAVRAHPRAWPNSPPSCSSDSTARCRPAPKDGMPPSGERSPRRSPRRRRGSGRPSRSPVIPGRSTAHRHSAESVALPAAARRPSRRRRPRATGGRARATRIGACSSPHRARARRRSPRSG